MEMWVIVVDVRMYDTTLTVSGIRTSKSFGVCLMVINYAYARRNR